MTITLSQIANSQSFGTGLERTNQILTVISSNALTADASSNGSLTTGNAAVNGFFSANVMIVTSNLRGGNTSTSNTITISSNSTFSADSLHNANVTVNSSLLVVNSATFQNSAAITGNVALSNTLTAVGNVVFSNTLSVTGASTFSNTVTITGNVALSNLVSIANNLKISGGITAASNLTIAGVFTANTTAAVVTGAATLSSRLSVAGNTTVSGILSVSSNATVNGTLFTVTNNANVGGNLNVSGNFFVNGNSTVTGTAFANGDFIPVQEDVYKLGNSTYGFITFTSNNSVSKSLNISNVSSTTTKKYSFANTSLQTVDNFAIATYRSAEYLIQMANSSAYQISKLLAVHDDTNAYVTEYGIMNTGSTMGTFSATISDGNFNLQCTPSSNTSIAAKIFRTAVTV